MTLDIIVAIILFFNIIWGIKKGLILSITSFFGLIFSAILSLNYLDEFYIKLISLTDTQYTNSATPYIKSFYNSMHENQFVYIVAYIILLIFFYFLIYILGIVLKTFFRLILLEWLDKLGGALFGFIKGSLISVILLSLISFSAQYNKVLKTTLNESYSFKYMPQVSKTFWSFVPFNTQSKIREYFDKKNLIYLFNSFVIEDEDIEEI